MMVAKMDTSKIRPARTPCVTSPQSATTRDDAAAKASIIDSQILFGCGKLIYIDHAGQRYTLRVTRENKLILTK
ncbi:conserved protein of unknown function [Sterolibacterium denitrificans]|uniref:Hemin uptake protein HemP n=2 Tax=Sterolibacterium denitrificans TaxID=157592 RepID=A0A7Z7HNV3_9PROT|nr:conserved protein of unknown function [Sterolibacterium denitrificans]